MFIIICEIDCQSRFDAWDMVLRAGTVGWLRRMGWGGRSEGASGWGKHVHPMADSCQCMAKTTTIFWSNSVQFSSVTQSFLTLCNPMNCSMPGLPVHHQLSEFTQTHVHRVGDAIQPSHPASSPSSPAPNPSQHQSLFQWVNSSHEVAKVLEFQL